jgi:flagellar biosynthesis/type III secretory pathway protein FliH
LYRLLILSGLRRLEEFVEQEARKMPILNDILENKVLGREFKRGLQEGLQEGREEGRQEGRQEGRLEGRQEGRQEGARNEAMTVLRRLVEKRFGAIPAWAEERLSTPSVSELEELILRASESRSLEELLK